MTQTIRVAGERDVVAIVPSLLGFQPSESLVVMLLSGGRVALTARLDLAHAWDRDALGLFTAPLGRARPDAAILVAYSDGLDRGTSDLLQLWADELPGRAETVGVDLDVLSAIQVGTGVARWRSIWVGDPAGQPLGDLRASPAGVGAIYAGCAPAPSREAAAALLEPGSDEAPAGFGVAAEAALMGLRDLGLGDARELLGDYLDRVEAGEDLPTEVLGAVAGLVALDAGMRAAMGRIDDGNAAHWQEFWSRLARLSAGILAYGPLVLTGASAIVTGAGMALNVAADHAAAIRPQHWGVAMLRRANDEAVSPSEWPVIREAVARLEPSA